VSDWRDFPGPNNEIDMSAVIGIRKRRKDSFKEQHGVGLGFMSFFVKATWGAR
jgi:2-oxoglutarate dehydrogenase E2 component (dihydrolipoamide succinyltransferase)